MTKKPKASEFKSEIKLPAGAEPKPEPKEALEPAPGLECRACGCRHFEVVYTRPAFGGKIQRCRACRHCGRRMMTIEVPVKEAKAEPGQPWWRRKRRP